VSGQRKALIVANDQYQQEALRNLLAPQADAEALGRVLGDPQIGHFTVQVVRNEPSHVIEAQIEDLFSESRSDDVLLLHFSGHGVKSESGELFFAATNTRPNRLRATAVSAEFVRQCMLDARSRSVVLLLDCCYGGAFAQGVKVKAAGDVHVLDSFPQGMAGGGRGRAVITASNAMEYAFEGDRLADDQHRRPSVFTGALVEGLATGDADRDEDGWVSLNELYDYVFDKVQERNPHQTPSRQVELEGELYLARSRRRRIRAGPIPPDLQAAMTDSNMFARVGAVHELQSRLASEDLPVAAGAYEALAEIARTDIQNVASLAAAAVRQASVQPEETELHFGERQQGSEPPHRMVRLLGPPIARACTPRASHDWIRVTEAPAGLDISVDTTNAGTLRGSLDLKGTTGSAVIAIDVELLPQVTQQPAPPQPSRPADQKSAAPAVPAPAAPPRLALSSSAVDFGRIRAGSRPKPRSVKVRNVGGGDLNARVASTPAWVEAQLTGGTLTLKAAPKKLGSLLGDVVIDTDGGSAAIRVTVNHAADQAQPRAGGLSVLRSKRTHPRPRVQYYLLCLAGLAIGIGFWAWELVVASNHHGKGNGWLGFVAFCGFVVAFIMFGRAAFRGRIRRRFWLFPPPWLDSELPTLLS
jgi:hypothetical protein